MVPRRFGSTRAVQPPGYQVVYIELSGQSVVSEVYDAHHHKPEYRLDEVNDSPHYRRVRKISDHALLLYQQSNTNGLVPSTSE